MPTGTSCTRDAISRARFRLDGSWDSLLRRVTCTLRALSAFASDAELPVASMAGLIVSCGLVRPKWRIVVVIPRDPAINPARCKASFPLGLLSTATRRRSTLVMNPFASNASRARRALSSSCTGSLDSAQRSIGGIANVVTTAIVTIIVKRSWLITPSERPMVATMTSVEPRAFMPQASASDSRPLSRPNAPPRNAPLNLPRLALAISPRARGKRSGSLSTKRSALSPAIAKKNRHEQCNNQTSQLLVDVLGQDRRFAHQDSCDKSSEHGVNADEMRHQRHCPHDDQDRGDDWYLADERVIGPTDQCKHETPAEREAHQQEQSGPEYALRQGRGIQYAMQRQAGGDCNNGPSHRVVDDGGGDERGPDFSSHKVHLSHDHCHDLDRRNRERRAEKHRGNQSLVGMWQHGLGQKLAEHESRNERHGNSCYGHAYSRAASPLYKLEVGFHPGQEQKHQDAEIGDRFEHRLLLMSAGKDRVLTLRPKRAEYRWTEANARDQLPHHGRLADPLHELAKKPAKQQQQHDLRDEESFRRNGWRLIRRECRGTRRERCAQPNGQAQCWSATGAQHLAHGSCLSLAPTPALDLDQR